MKAKKAQVPCAPLTGPPEIEAGLENKRLCYRELSNKCFAEVTYGEEHMERPVTQQSNRPKGNPPASGAACDMVRPTTAGAT